MLIKRSIRKYIISSEENICQEFTPKSIEKTRHFLIEEIIQNELKVHRVLNYIEHLLILISTVTGCAFVSASASLVGIPVETTSSATG